MLELVLFMEDKNQLQQMNKMLLAYKIDLSLLLLEKDLMLRAFSKIKTDTTISK